MRQEKGVEQAVNSFHRRLPVDSMVCDLLPGNAARWQYTGKTKNAPRSPVKLSNEALKILLDAKKVKLQDFKP